jgi:NADP-dependent 3-hydroxy acid dehydrogenase YdfG
LIRLDVTNQSQIEAAVEIVKQGGRGLYGIVNSAGIAPSQLHILKGISESNVDKEVKPIIDINFLGTVRVNTAFSDLILESKGCFVNLSSMASRVPLVGKAITYSASKAGISASHSNAYRKKLSICTPLRYVLKSPNLVLEPSQCSQDSWIPLSMWILTEKRTGKTPNIKKHFRKQRKSWKNFLLISKVIASRL